MEFEREWYTIADSSRYLNMDVADIEHLLETRKLKAEYKILPGATIPPHNYSNEQLLRLVRYHNIPASLITYDILPIGEIRIPRAEVERYKAQTMKSNTTLASQSLAQPYLDPQHKHYSEELAIAVNTWLTLYADNGSFNVRRSHKEQIKTALNSKGLSNSAIDRIAILVNPNKEGGAPATDY